MSKIEYKIGDCLELTKELEKESIDLIMFSPPYYGLRDYGVDGQWGLEKHPKEYIEKFIILGKELKRVLKKSGSMYIVLGDTYWGSGAGQKDTGKAVYTQKEFRKKPLTNIKSNWLQPKQLMLIPSRVAIALQDDGWILRNQIVWHKPNAMPSSVTDRLTNTYELVYHFVKGRKYYYDLDSIRMAHKEISLQRYKRAMDFGGMYADGSKADKARRNGLGYPRKAPKSFLYKGKFKDMGTKSEEFSSPRARTERKIDKTAEFFIEKDSGGNINLPADTHIKGKNPGDFWKVTTKGYKEAHFAVFPEALIIPIIKSSCPQFVCKKCGKPREKIIKTTKPRSKGGIRNVGDRTDGYTTNLPSNCYAEKEFIGWSNCGCNEGFENGTVLDPFVGSGTTLEVAMKLGRNALGFELNPAYEELIKKRIKANIKDIETFG